VLTARAENYLHGLPDLADTIRRLQAFEAAGADVLYAPGVRDLGEIRSIVASVGLPVNVLALAGVPSLAELVSVGVRRVSVGGSFAWAAMGALVEAAEELLGQGSYGYLERSAIGSAAVKAAFVRR
jgi:2-methylisocitrate lyase-like PEP mutase family enzyme